MVFHSPIDGTVDIDNAREIFQTARHPKSFCSLDLATHTIKQMGFKNVSHMRGGFDRWVKEIGRVEPGKKPKVK